MEGRRRKGEERLVRDGEGGGREGREEGRGKEGEGKEREEGREEEFYIERSIKEDHMRWKRARIVTMGMMKQIQSLHQTLKRRVYVGVKGYFGKQSYPKHAKFEGGVKGLPLLCRAQIFPTKITPPREAAVSASP